MQMIKKDAGHHISLSEKRCSAIFGCDILKKGRLGYWGILRGQEYRLPTGGVAERNIDVFCRETQSDLYRYMTFVSRFFKNNGGPCMKMGSVYK